MAGCTYPKLVAITVAAIVPTVGALAPSVSGIASNNVVPPVVNGPTFSKKLSTPDGVPEAGQQRAMELMRSGALFRYTPGVLSEVSLAEEAVSDYSGFGYAVGFNSCGSALFITLKCVGVEVGDHVLANAFSFTAVPSAIHHAGAIPVFVESTDAYVMDMDDLEKKITPKTKVLLLTHMRGKVTDMQRVYEIADKHGLTVVEDCAHALGIQWDGVQLGRSARIACFSTQSAKMINSGEGGFLCTDDEEAAAKAICYAGCYELLYDQHTRAPPAAVFEKVKKATPNYSLRMSDLTACCVRPQLETLDDRIEVYNNRYAAISARLAERAEYIEVPAISERVRPVCDSIQFNLRGLRPDQISSFLGHTKRRGMPLGLFGSKDNARNFRNWQYSPIATECDKTEHLISVAVDMRLPLSFEDEDFDQMADVVLASVDDVLAEEPNVEGEELADELTNYAFEA